MTKKPTFKFFPIFQIGKLLASLDKQWDKMILDNLAGTNWPNHAMTAFSDLAELYVLRNTIKGVWCTHSEPNTTTNKLQFRRHRPQSGSITASQTMRGRTFTRFAILTFILIRQLMKMFLPNSYWLKCKFWLGIGIDKNP